MEILKGGVELEIQGKPSMRKESWEGRGEERMMGNEQGCEWMDGMEMA
jgi:hypothetical protein